MRVVPRNCAVWWLASAPWFRNPSYSCELFLESKGKPIGPTLLKFASGKPAVVSLALSSPFPTLGALALNFFFDQSLASLLRAHVEAFQQFQGSPRAILYDNMRSVVLARYQYQVRFHPRLLELAAHYHFAAHPCRPARGNEKGRVERVIRFIRDSFFAARPFTTLEDFNRQA